jgi:hypothetical protein
MAVHSFGESPEETAMRSRTWSAAPVLVCLAIAPAWGQWSSDPSVNLPLADRANGSDQVQPKLEALPDGSFWVSWFDSNPDSPPPVGYDVRLQLLSPAGLERFAHGGLLIADLRNSSTQDYGLDSDADGNALLAFLDGRHSTNEQVSAAKVSPTGKLLWHGRTVLLTTDAAFHAAPKIAGTGGGDVVVAWTSDDTVVAQRLDGDGNPKWGSGVVLSEPGLFYALADMHAAEDGSVILSWVRSSGFFGDKQLRTNKLSSTGELLWGPQHVAVFDTGSLQFGNFPSFLPDGSGGAVFSWYTSSPSLQVYAQHVRADGSEAFPHGGSAVSADTRNVRVAPSASYDAARDETFVFWTEEDALQALNGVSGQKLDGTGARRWGPRGLTIVPLAASSRIFVQSVPVGTGALVFWVDQESFTSSTIQATRLDGRGNVRCPQFSVATDPANPFGLVAGIAPSDLAVLAWSDSRIGNNAIYVQNVNPDCSLGLHD